MARTLSNATKDAAKALDKLSKARTTPTETQSTSLTTAKLESTAVTIGADNRVSVAIPGLFQMTEQSLPSMIPQYDPSKFTVADPLNPPDTIPIATMEQFEKGKGIYEGGIRALQLHGLAFDLTREKFNVVGKQAKAFTAGFSALTEQEKAKGAYLGYQAQTQVTQQQGMNYQAESHRTLRESEALPHLKTQLDEALKQQEAKANMAKAKTSEMLDKLTQFQKAIGQYSEPNKSAI